ncbi:hypothetical protein QQ045_018614 [Rhodiola kirilowii]
MAEDLNADYARIASFVVRLATSNRSAGIITIKYLVCQREGFKPKSKVVDSMNIADHKSRSRRYTRCGCQARIQLNIGDGGRYRVYFFEESHNHSLESDIGAFARVPFTIFIWIISQPFIGALQHNVSIIVE